MASKEIKLTPLQIYFGSWNIYNICTFCGSVRTEKKCFIFARNPCPCCGSIETNPEYEEPVFEFWNPSISNIFHFGYIRLKDFTPEQLEDITEQKQNTYKLKN